MAPEHMMAQKQCKRMLRKAFFKNIFAKNPLGSTAVIFTMTSWDPHEADEDLVIFHYPASDRGPLSKSAFLIVRTMPASNDIKLS